MTTNTHESTLRAVRYAQHVGGLLKAFDVRVEVLPVALADRAGAGYVAGDLHRAVHERRRVIRCAYVIDEVTYAAALHELGHVLSPLGMMRHAEGSAAVRAGLVRLDTLRDCRLLLEEERQAWRWARHQAFEWTDAMDALAAYCMDSYLTEMRRYGVKEERWLWD